MKSLLRFAAYAVAVVGAFAGLLFLASESGEVVVLTSFDEADTAHETRLWIVDREGRSYLRAGSPESGWFGRVQRNPRVVVERGGRTFHARLTPGGIETREINALMGSKYGLADMIVGAVFPRDDSVGLRIVPL